MPAVALTAEDLQHAAARAEELARRLPNLTHRLAAERMRRRADAVAQGATVEDLALAGDAIAMFCLKGKAS